MIHRIQTFWNLKERLIFRITNSISNLVISWPVIHSWFRLIFSNTMQLIEASVSRLVKLTTYSRYDLARCWFRHVSVRFRTIYIQIFIDTLGTSFIVLYNTERLVHNVFEKMFKIDYFSLKITKYLSVLFQNFFLLNVIISLID